MDARKIFREDIALLAPMFLDKNEIEKEIKQVKSLKNPFNGFYSTKIEDILVFLKRNPLIYKAIQYSPNLDLFLKLSVYGMAFDFSDSKSISLVNFTSEILFSLQIIYLSNVDTTLPIGWQSNLTRKIITEHCEDINEDLKIFCFQNLKQQLNLHDLISKEREEKVIQFAPKLYLTFTIIQDFFVASVIAEKLLTQKDDDYHFIIENITSPRFESINYFIAGLLQNKLKEFQAFFDLLLAKLPRKIESLYFLLTIWIESNFAVINDKSYLALMKFRREILQNLHSKSDLLNDDTKKMMSKIENIFAEKIQSKYTYIKNNLFPPVIKTTQPVPLNYSLYLRR